MHRPALGDVVQLATRIPKRLYRAVRLQALAEERSVMAFVAEALAEHLARVRDRDRNAPPAHGSGARSLTTGPE
jgi:hypothetical protein